MEEYTQLNIKVPMSLVVKLKEIEVRVCKQKLEDGLRAYASRAEILKMALDALEQQFKIDEALADKPVDSPNA